MSRIAVDELDRIDEAIVGNRLLATFPPETRALVEPFATIVELKIGEEIQSPGSAVSASFFPLKGAMVALVIDLEGGRSVEVASIGYEGAVGGIVSCGRAPAFARARVLVPGRALRIPMDVLEDAKARSGHIRNLFCRFSDYLLAQVMQTVACNTHHSINQRAARWLLTAQDRSGSEIELTQEGLAGLLGVQRTTVNAVIRTLQDEGLIAARRGAIRVIDRAALKRRACKCYVAVESHFASVIGTSGTGGSEDCD